MTNHLTDEAVKALLDSATPGPWRADGEPWNRVVWSSADNRVCFMAHSNGMDDGRDTATSDLAAAAPDLARALLDARAELARVMADAQAAVALVVEKAEAVAAERERCAAILDTYETIDDESAARGVRWQVDLPAQIAVAIRAKDTP